MQPIFKTLGHRLLLTIDNLLLQEVRRGSDLALFRARSLFLLCLVVTVIFALASVVVVIDQNLNRGSFIILILLMSIISLFACMRSTRHDVIGAVYLGLFSLFISRQLLHFNSLFLPGVFGYPAVILAGFLLCGRNIGLLLGAWTLLHSSLTLLTLQRTGWNAPLNLSWIQLTQNYVGFSFFVLVATVCIISSYQWLINKSRHKYELERAWLETAETMQDVLALAAKISKSFEKSLQIMLQTSQELSRSPEAPQQSAQWTRGLLDLDQNARQMQRFHRSFQLITDSLYKDHLEKVDPLELAQHLLALCGTRPNGFKIMAEPAGSPMQGRLSSIVLLLVVIWQEALDQPEVGKPRRLQLTQANQRLLAEFDGGVATLPRLAEQLSRALHAEIKGEGEQGNWTLSIPLQAAG